MSLLKCGNTIRLHGKALAELNLRIHERDQYKCIVCGRSVPLGVKFHHEHKAGLKSDVEEQGVTLCYACHQERHFGRMKEVRSKCEEYLAKLYKGE